MAFNPFITFQKNRRFWMAAILMICMVSFVFCTGLKGDMAERLQWMLGRRGDPAFRLDGRTYTTQQVYELRTQRKLANKLMMNCADMAYKKLQKAFFDLQNKKDTGNAKDDEERQQRLVQILGARESIAHRKARQYYFETGTKYDDLVEFAVWQNVADKLGIRLEEDHVKTLYEFEFFRVLEPQEIFQAEQITMRDFRDVSPDFMRRAITEEFRVRMAQEAYATAQPSAYFSRKRQTDGISFKFTDPTVPDEIRMPLTFAQLWDSYKKNRSEFDVTLLPIDVSKYLASLKVEPSATEKDTYYKDHRDKPVDPNSDVRGLVLPQKIKVEYVYADPYSPAYLESAKLVEALKVHGLIAPEAMLSPLATLSRYWILHEQHMEMLQAHSENLGRNERNNPFTAPFSARDCVSPILARLARGHAEANVSAIGSQAITLQDPFGSLAGYLAWGALKHEDELNAALHAELKRRAPIYATAFAATTTPFPVHMAAPFAAMDLQKTPYAELPWLNIPPTIPVEVVRRELEEMIARRAAEEKAQQNMQIVRAALDKSADDAEKFRRELNQLVPELKLTYGPSETGKQSFISRHTLDTVKELDPLREAFVKSIDMINLFEGRDLTPTKLLTPADFHKMFFDSSEGFSATASYRAMPWPPRVKANNTRMLQKQPDPRLINRENVDPRAQAAFNEYLAQQNPLAPAPVFDDLFKNAAKPILFWRTAKRDPATLPTKFEELEVTVEVGGKKVTKDGPTLEKLVTEYKENDQHIKKLAELSPKIDALRKQEATLRKSKADSKDVQRVRDEIDGLLKNYKKIEEEAGGSATYLRNRQMALKENEADFREVLRLVVEGWKFEKARSEIVVPLARKEAETLIKNGNQGIFTQAAKLEVSPFTVSRLCRMFPERMPDGSLDYGKPPLPKEKFVFPRENTIDDLISLYDLTEPIKIGNKEIDDVNESLFRKVKDEQNVPIGHYVQVLTNRPRSVFYVAFVSRPPEAKKDDFISSLRGAAVPRDHFVQRIQQQDGREFRRNMVKALREAMEYSQEPAGAKLKTDLDTAVSSD